MRSMAPSPSQILFRLRQAILIGKLAPQDTLAQTGQKLMEIFECDSLDLVELEMALEEKNIRPVAVGEVLNLFEDMDPKDPRP